LCLLHVADPACTLCLYLSNCFLLQLVSTLLADNRRLRRQAMQLQLQAAGDSLSSAGQLDAAPLPQTQAAPAATLDAQQQLVPVDQPQAVPAAGAAGAQAEADAAAAAEAALREALRSAEQHVSVLSDENERLMDLSNGLRAENEGLKKALNLQVR
jgi:hypothetical protein